jgi:hypothetical protein
MGIVGSDFWTCTGNMNTRWKKSGRALLFWGPENVERPTSNAECQTRRFPRAGDCAISYRAGSSLPDPAGDLQLLDTNLRLR